jgi:hypothetical protein
MSSYLSQLIYGSSGGDGGGNDENDAGQNKGAGEPSKKSNSNAQGKKSTSTSKPSAASKEKQQKQKTNNGEKKRMRRDSGDGTATGAASLATITSNHSVGTHTTIGSSSSITAVRHSASTETKAKSLLDALYKLSAVIPASQLQASPTQAVVPSQASVVSAALPSFSKNPVVARQSEHAQRVRNAKKRARFNLDDPREELNYWKRERKFEYNELRKRWKRRQWDLRSEEDFGNAYETRARLVVKQHKKKKRRRLLEPGRGEEAGEQQQPQQQEQENNASAASVASSASRGTKRNRRSSTFEEGNDVVQQELNKDINAYVDSSDEEQDHILQRLSQGRHNEEDDDEKKKKAQKEQEEFQSLQKEIEKHKQPYSENLDYWEQGLAAPRRQDLGLFLYSRDKVDRSEFFNQKKDSILLEESDKEEDGDNDIGNKEENAFIPCKVRFQDTDRVFLRGAYNSKQYQPDRNCYVQFPLHNSIVAHGNFVHARNVFRMASRYILLGGGHDNHYFESRMQTESRLLRALWQPAWPYKTRRFYLHLAQLEQHGINYETFLMNEWINAKSRALAATRLGITAATSSSSTSSAISAAEGEEFYFNDMLGPVQMVGLSLQASFIQWVMNKERVWLMRYHSTGKCVPIMTTTTTTETITTETTTATRALPTTSTNNNCEPPHPPVAEIPFETPQTLSQEPVDSHMTDGVDPLIDSTRERTMATTAAATTTRTRTKKIDLNDELTRRRVIHPTVGYLHIPGTTPPTPSFPLDETNLVFGPSDTHITFRQVGPIDESMYNLTLSSLLNRLAILHARITSESDYDGGTNAHTLQQQLQHQLVVLLEGAPVMACNKMYKYMERRTIPIGEVHLVQYYRTIMSFCSFVASGCPQSKSVGPGNDDDEDDDNNIFSSLADHPTAVAPENTYAAVIEILSMREVAEKIYTYCESHIGHNGLQAFPRVHITYALACIARLLPPSAAKILSHPLDDLEYRTPFDLFRKCLEHLEAEGLLVSDDHDNHAAAARRRQWSAAGGFQEEEDPVRVGELEYALHQAAEIFGSCCVERHPLEIDYHAWYLGALAASLLLCSGNRIDGAGAVLPMPSSCYTDLDHSDNRNTLPKFNEVRQDTRKALKLMTRLLHHQPTSARVHLAVSSFLEWTQVVALLGGRSCRNPAQLKELKRCYYRHSTQWAITVKSRAAMDYIQCLSGGGGQKSANCMGFYDIELKQLANAVENDPDDIKNWRNLASKLGPVGVGVSEMEDSDHCNDSSCQECRLLRDGLAVNHASLEARKSSGNWWGSDCVAWWNHHFLVFPPGHQRLEAEDVEKLEQVIDKNLASTVVGIVPRSAQDHPFAGPKPSLCDLKWFWDENTASGDADGDIIDEQGDATIQEIARDSFPMSFVDILQQGKTAESESEVDLVDAEVEHVYLKAVISCHLFGLKHSGIDEVIFELARKSVDDDFVVREDSSEWHCLQKLYKMGLNVSCFLQLYRENAVARQKQQGAKVRFRYTELQRTTMREAIERHGYEKWAHILRSYEAFEGMNKFAVLVRFIILVLIVYKKIDPDKTFSMSVFDKDLYKWVVEHEGLVDRRVSRPFPKRKERPEEEADQPHESDDDEMDESNETDDSNEAPDNDQQVSLMNTH